MIQRTRQFYFYTSCYRSRRKISWSEISGRSSDRVRRDSKKGEEKFWIRARLARIGHEFLKGAVNTTGVAEITVAWIQLHSSIMQKLNLHGCEEDRGNIKSSFALQSMKSAIYTFNVSFYYRIDTR